MSYQHRCTAPHADGDVCLYGLDWLRVRRCPNHVAWWHALTAHVKQRAKASIYYLALLSAHPRFAAHYVL